MDETTLRVRPTLPLRETLERVARERGVSYRRLLQHLIRQALQTGYKPKTSIEERRVESRIPLTREEKNTIRALTKGCQPKLTPEEWVFEIMENYEQFLEADEEQDDRKRAGIIFG
mgnify:CR=1 FL=1